MNKKQEYCGYIAIIGRPNVGKSTLMNKIVGHNISITSQKKNTTQKNITGIKTNKFHQFIYIDTPGVYFYDIKNLKIVKNIDLIIFVIDRNIWKKEDEIIFNKIKKINVPIVYVINKIDKLLNKNHILPYIGMLSRKTNSTDIVPISTIEQKNISLLENVIRKYLPKNRHIFPANYITTNSFNFSISEIIRKQLIFFLRDELPSTLTVKIESIQEIFEKLHIRSIIYVNNQRQKKIVIGYQGEIIKKISMSSRLYIEKENNRKVYLLIWVKEKIKKY